ncbi:vacuolar membrane-associated protein iml1 [Basidiobolus ranarum]|uniref:Vacuolar membrane-associated protein IML1 n=1 Tax=Basidiobolus ranarum TaxID=34480 RepID=A0ABR2WSX5_9FUNG
MNTLIPSFVNYTARGCELPNKQSSPSKGFNSRQVIRQSLIKPCNPAKNVIKISSHLRRWHHIFPKPVPIDCTKWTSLCSPACLPLTTDFFPTPDELADFYQEYTYTVSPNDEVNAFSYQDAPASGQSITERLLLDMISQRLAQGFQLVVPNSIETSQKSSDHHLSFSPAENNNGVLALSRSSNNEYDGSKFGGNKSSATTPYYLSMGHHVHKLWYDNTGQNVEVKRYVRRLAYTIKPISYSCAVWPKYMDGYQPRQVSFHYPVLSQYNWNYLDHLISGYQDEMTDSLRFWRARFALIPMEVVPSNHLTNPSNENLDDEELRLAGFFKFQELLWKVRWDPNQEKGEARNNNNRKQISNKLDIKFTTCNISTFVANHSDSWGESTDFATMSIGSRKGSGYLANGEKMITKEAKLSTVATAMQNPITGVKLQDRRWHFKLFEGVFVGNEFVDWLIKEFSDLESRDDALEFGNNLMTQGLFIHVYKKHRLLDGHYFYQLESEYAAARATKSWGVFRNTKNNNESNSKPSDDQASMSEKRPAKIDLSRSITIDIDNSKRSDRPERAILHYDVVHNPKTCYHFQLDWLDCTARLIEDLLQSWARTADKCGLRLVEVPVQQARMDTSENPFQAPVAIRMTAPPPPLSILEKKAGNLVHIPHLYFETELAKHHGFVLEQEADELFPTGVEITHSYYKTPARYSQYIHRSGVAIIQICDPGEGFLWVNNRLFTSHSNSGNQNKNILNQLPNPDILRLQFQRFCQDTKQLNDFWEDTTSKFSVETLVENCGSDLQTVTNQSSVEKEID